MNFQQATDALVALLDVSDKRYPLLTAQLHVNQACLSLSQDNDLWFDRYIIDRDYNLPVSEPSGPEDVGSLSVASLSIPGLFVGYIKNLYWKVGEIFKPLDAWEYRELLLTHQDESGEPQNFALQNRRILIRPVPEVASTVRAEIKGNCAIIGGSDTNGWLTNAPFAVLYKAAVYAAIYMMEDKRVSVFSSMFADEAERMALHAGMMVSSEPRQAREIG